MCFYFPADSFFACHTAGAAERNCSAGTGTALSEGSAVWILLNNPVFLLNPLSVSIVPQPFASSAFSSAAQEAAGQMNRVCKALLVLQSIPFSSVKSVR